MEAGSTQVLKARREIAIRVGDAGAAAWTVNGRALPPMGGPGQVRDVVVTPENAPDHQVAGRRVAATPNGLKGRAPDEANGVRYSSHGPSTVSRAHRKRLLHERHELGRTQARVDHDVAELHAMNEFRRGGERFLFHARSSARPSLSRSSTRTTGCRR